jgi:hypothetical protein
MSLGDVLGVAALPLVLLNLLVYTLRVRAVRVPLRPLGHAAVMLAAVGLFAAALFNGASFLGVASGTSALITAGFFIVHVFTSGLPVKEIAVEIGKPFPSFEAVDADSHPFRTSSLLGSPVLLIFFRGWW